MAEMTEGAEFQKALFQDIASKMRLAKSSGEITELNPKFTNMIASSGLATRIADKIRDLVENRESMTVYDPTGKGDPVPLATVFVVKQPDPGVVSIFIWKGDSPAGRPEGHGIVGWHRGMLCCLPQGFPDPEGEDGEEVSLGHRLFAIYMIVAMTFGFMFDDPRNCGPAW